MADGTENTSITPSGGNPPGGLVLFANKEQKKKDTEEPKAKSYEGTGEQDLVDEDIDERILRLLGLEDVFDIDYGTYLSLLKEKLIASRSFGTPLSQEEDDLLRSELKRVKGKVGRFKLKSKKISASSFLKRNVGGGAEKGPIGVDQKKYFISGTAVTSQFLPPAKDDSNEKLLDIVISIRKTVESIYKTLSDQAKLSEKEFELGRRSRENQARKGKEEGLEKKKSPSLLKAADKLITPAKGLLEKIFDFIFAILLGRAFGAFMDWASDPKNAKKVASLARFIKDWWPALLAAWFFFANPLGKFIRSIVGSIAKLTFSLLKPALKSLAKAAMKNPKAAAVIAGGAALATAGAWVPAMFPETVDQQERKTAEASKTPEGKQKVQSELQRKAENPNIWERITGQDAEAKEQLEFQKTGKTKSYGFSSGGNVDTPAPVPQVSKINSYTFNSGGNVNEVTSQTGKKVTGAGRDTQLVDVVGNDGKRQGNAVIKVGEVVLNEQQQAKIASDHGINVKDYVKNAKPKTISSDKLGLSGGGIVKYESGGVVGQQTQSRADTRSTAPSGGTTQIKDTSATKAPDTKNKGNGAILTAAKKAVQEGKRGPASPPCASWVRMVLGMAGHPSAEKTTQKGDLDPEKKPWGRNMAASFAGSDMGQVLNSQGALQGGDIVLQKNTFGSWPAGAITHVSIASDKPGKILHQSTSGGAPKESGLFNFAYGVRLPGSGVTGPSGGDAGTGGGGTGGGQGTTGTGGGGGSEVSSSTFNSNSLLGRIKILFGANQEENKGTGAEGSGDSSSGDSSAGGGGGGGNANIQLGSTEYKALMIETMNKGGITDKNERIMFMAQVGHESGEGRYLEEIASGSAYEGRSDLGNTQPGDGKKFKGRGYIQITGRANYKKYGPKVGVPDATENPQKLAEPKTAAKVALAYWLDRVDRNAAKKGMAGMNTVTRNINGGLNGLDDRIAKFKKYESDTSIQSKTSAAKGGGLISSYLSAEDGGLIGLAKGGPATTQTTSAGGGGAENQVMSYFISNGLTKDQAAGIAGNLKQESGFRPTADNGSHYGISQWDKQHRWPKVAAYIKSQGKEPNSLEGQLVGLKWEAEQRGDWNKIKSETTATGAAASWLKNFEGSGEKPGQAGYENRMKYASTLAGGSYSGGSTATETPEKGEGGKNAPSSGSTEVASASVTPQSFASMGLLDRIKQLFGAGGSDSESTAATTGDSEKPEAPGAAPSGGPSGPMAPGTGKAATNNSEGSKIAGEAGRYIKSKLKSPQQFQAVTEHPEHGGVRGGHAPGSWHYTKPGRAIDIGAYAHEQGPILKVIQQFNKEKNVKPVELLKAGDPGHNDHVHVAYKGGGSVKSRGFGSTKPSSNSGFVNPLQSIFSGISNFVAGSGKPATKSGKSTSRKMTKGEQALSGLIKVDVASSPGDEVRSSFHDQYGSDIDSTVDSMVRQSRSSSGYKIPGALGGGLMGFSNDLGLNINPLSSNYTFNNFNFDPKRAMSLDLSKTFNSNLQLGAKGGGAIPGVSGNNIQKVTTNTGQDITTAGADTQKTTVPHGSFILTKKTTSSLEKVGSAIKGGSIAASSGGGVNVALQPGETIVSPQGVKEAGGVSALEKLNESHDASATNKPRVTKAYTGGKIEKAASGGMIGSEVTPLSNLVNNFSSVKNSLLPFDMNKTITPNQFELASKFAPLPQLNSLKTNETKPATEIDTTCTCVSLEDILDKLKKNTSISEPPGPPVNKNAKPTITTLPEVNSGASQDSSMPANSQTQIPPFPAYASASLEIRTHILKEYEVVY